MSRHELPEDNDLTHQNIRDRYYGTNDPVAKKMLNRVRGGNTALTPPEDKTVVCIIRIHVRGALDADNSPTLQSI